MSDCTRCGSTDIISVELNNEMLVGDTAVLAPDVFPFAITYCSFCGFVPRGLPHDGYFNYQNNYNNPLDAREAHYHKEGWHFEFVTKGSFDYYQRPIGSKEKPLPITVSQGQLFFIPPMVEHGLVFKEITALISMPNKGRAPDDLVGVLDDFLGEHNPGASAYNRSKQKEKL